MENPRAPASGQGAFLGTRPRRDPETLREKWKDIATISGPDGLRAIRGFHDEALAGEWKGCRSSRLNEQWRVIYSVEAGVMTVLVIRVTPHDYRRR